MASEVPGGTTSGMVARIKNILTTPTSEWTRIDGEPATVQGLMIGWVVPLAAIAPLCLLIGSTLFGYASFFGVTIRQSLTFAISTAVTSYVFALIGAYVCALVFDALAPSFGGTKNPVQAMKAVAYSWTAAWLAGVFQLIPMLGVLGIVGLYSLYLLWVGLPMMMKVPKDKAPGYVAVSVVAAIVVVAIVMVVGNAVAGLFAPHVVAPSLTFG